MGEMQTKELPCKTFKCGDVAHDKRGYCKHHLGIAGEESREELVVVEGPGIRLTNGNWFNLTDWVSANQLPSFASDVNTAVSRIVEEEKKKAFSDGMRRADTIWLNRNKEHVDGEVSWMVQNEAVKYEL